MTTSTEKPTGYQPSEIWTPDMEPDEPIRRAVDQINAQNPARLLKRLKKQTYKSEDGIVHSYLVGEHSHQYSHCSAIVLFNPYANSATPNMLRRAEFIRLVAKEYGVVDTFGQYLPVIMLANPGLGGSRMKLDEEDRQKIRQGDLGPYARELLRAVQETSIGRVALCGFSQGADVAAEGYMVASQANLDVMGLAVGDPAATRKRSTRVLRKDFMQTGPSDLYESIARGGIEDQKKYQGAQDFLRFLLSSLAPINQDLYKAMRFKDFGDRIRRIIDLQADRRGKPSKITVAYGSHSAIAQPHTLEPVLKTLQDLDDQDILTTIRVDEADHTWGDQLDLLAKLYMRALL